MKQTKLEQIHRVREAAKLLRRRPHAQVCACCKSDLDLIEEEADAPFAPHLLKRVSNRCDTWLLDTHGARPR